MNKNKSIEELWVGMPEFVQEDKESFASVVVHFESVDDMDLFSKMIGKNITKKTKGIFFPVKIKKDKEVYVDES